MIDPIRVPKRTDRDRWFAQQPNDYCESREDEFREEVYGARR